MIKIKNTSARAEVFLLVDKVSTSRVRAVEKDADFVFSIL